MSWMIAAVLALGTPGVAEKANDGPFEAVVVAVPDLEAFDREWAVATAGAEITSTERLVRNKPTYIVVLFGGCVKNDRGNCQIDVRHVLMTPDGKPYDGLDGTKANPVADIPMTRTDAFFLAPQVLGVEIEPGEQLGPYRLHVTVADMVAGRKVSSELTLTAVESE
jgi:hypothetical protein